MIRQAALIACFVAANLIGSTVLVQPAAAEKPKIKAVIITGGHGYDVKNFPKAYEGFDDIAVDVRTDKDPNAIFDDISDWKYDVVVLYNFNNKISDKQKENFLKLLEKGVGLVVWHHGISAYPAWPEFEKIAGAKYWLKAAERDGVKIPQSGYKHDVTFKVHIEETKHPITAGVKDFEILDETYVRQTFEKDSQVLATTDESTSDKPVAFVRQYAKSKVFSLQLGHDAKAWANEGFRKLFSQGIRWTAGKI